MNKDVNYFRSIKIFIMCMTFFLFGDVYASGEIVINTEEEFLNIASNQSGSYVLNNDLDFSDKTFTTIPNFSGTLDGNGKTISNIYINNSNNNVGIFGTNSGTIKNLGIVGININARNNVGAVAGENTSTGTIDKVYVVGSVSGSQDVGNIVGRNSGSISNVYAHGNTFGKMYVGGIVGNLQETGTVSNAYNIGSTKADASFSSAGIVGYFEDVSNISNVYSIDNPIRGEGGNNVAQKTLDDFSNEATYIGMDMTNVWEMGGAGYAVLKNIPHINMNNLLEFDGGEGTNINPYLISNISSLNKINKYLACSFALVSDIDLSTGNFTGIGSESNSFKGFLDGCSHKIRNLSLNSDNYLGFIKNNDGEIKDLAIIGADVNGVDNIGALVGYNGIGIIERCYVVAANVNGNNNVGTISGTNKDGKIKNVFGKGIVFGNANNGGIVGNNYGTLENTYYIGNVNGNIENGIINSGSIIGFNDTSSNILGHSYYSTNNFPQIGIGTGNKDIGNIKSKTELAFKDITTFLNFDSSIWSNGNISPQITDNPYIGVTGISVSKSAIILGQDETTTLHATVTPSDATYKKVIWSSSNENVATVDQNGLVTAIDVGQAEIKAISKDGNYIATVTLDVSAPEYIVTIPELVEFKKDKAGQVQSYELNIEANVEYAKKGKVVVETILEENDKYYVKELRDSNLKLGYAMYRNSEEGKKQITNSNNTVASFTTSGISTVYLEPEANWKQAKPGVYEGNMSFTIDYILN